MDANRPIKDGLTLLHLVAAKGIPYLRLKLHNKVNSNTVESLFFYPMAGLPKIAEILLNNKADVNVVDSKNLVTPLHIAAYSGGSDEYYAIVELLINAGANINSINSENDTPLDVARDDRSKFV